MKKKNKKMLVLGVSLFTTFVLWTILVSFVNVQAIGPRESSVGFANLNGYIHNLIGVNMFLYTITDWLGLVPISLTLVFTILGLVQLIKRKSLWRVDYNILILGAFYFVVILIYILFEIIVINYRPTLINGELEASYPSSTTMLVMCVMTTSAIELKVCVKNTLIRWCIIILLIAFTAFMVATRLLSGVHWITDIIGSILLSTSLVIMYYSIRNILTKKC